MIRNYRSIEEKSDNLSKERISLIIAVIGVFISLYGLVLFNQNILRAIPLIPRMAVMIISQWAIFLVPYLLMKRNHETLSDLGFSRVKIGNQVLTGILLAIGMSVVFIMIPIFTGFRDMIGSTSYTMPWQFAFQFVYSILGVALAEELVFRGYLFEKIYTISSSRNTAIILSSVLFGFYHIFNGNILQVVMTFFIGILFCLFREKIKSCTILSLIIAHGIYDGMIVLLVKLL